MKNCFVLFALLAALSACRNRVVTSSVVFQSDFGLKDGAVSAMKGVAKQVDPALQLYDLTHEIPAYNIWEAAYRLEQTAPFWPAGTVFVSVVDPGVGTERKSVVMKAKNGQYFVTPDNGTLTLVSETFGIEEVRQIDEKLNRRENSGQSYTFHGRDVYAYTAARLASGTITFEEVGPVLSPSVIKIPYQNAALQGDSIKGAIPILDIQYGNVWSNIPGSLVSKLITENNNVRVTIYHNDSLVYTGVMPLSNTFGEVPLNAPLAYMNSLMNFSTALNQGSFADSFHIGSGPGWSLIIKKQ